MADADILALRPMDTAPRDGSSFWGIVDGDARRMFYHAGFGAFVGSFHRITLAPGHTYADTGLNYRDHSPEIHRPTAWLPIPAAVLAMQEAASHG